MTQTFDQGFSPRQARQTARALLSLRLLLP
jgi:hypothetical protein